ncbi:MAG: hypothetical protein ACYCYR_15700 [Desulfobulbaceae bacterium]
MALVLAKIRTTGKFAEDIVGMMIDAMMGAAVEFMETIRSMHGGNHEFLISWITQV